MAIQSKNQKSNRGVGQRVRMLNGKKVIAVKYVGHWGGHGTYMAGAVDEKLVCDKNGKPLPLRDVGELVLA